MNQRGSITISLLVLTPLFLAVLACSAGTYLTIRTDAKSRHICRVQLLSSQMRVAQLLEDLLALNSSAHRLRREREIADRNVRLAPPAVKFIAVAHQLTVIGRQLVLAAKQKELILRGKLESFKGPSSASRKISEGLAHDQALFSDRSVQLSAKTSVDVAFFDVVPEPRGSLTPDYLPSANFERRQTMRLRWQMSVGPLLPSWLTDSFTTQKFLAQLKLKAECSATLRKENSKWQPILSAASL